MMGSARRVSYEKGDGRDFDSLVHSEFLGTWPQRSGRHRQRCECNLTSSQRRRIDPLWKKDMASRISTCATIQRKRERTDGSSAQRSDPWATWPEPA